MLGTWNQLSTLMIQIQFEMCETCLWHSLTSLYKCTASNPEKTSLTHPHSLLSYLTCQQTTEVTETNSATICSGFELGENTSTSKHSQANRQANMQTFLNSNNRKHIHSVFTDSVCPNNIHFCLLAQWREHKHDFQHWMNNSQHSWNVYPWFPCWRHTIDLIYT